MANGDCTGTGWQEVYLGGSAETERRRFEELARRIREVQLRLRRRSKALAVRRAFHAKMLAGVANARFTISADLPADLQVDLLRPGAEYPATVRFSNAAGTMESDEARDLRGVAFRIAGTDGDLHDFLMTNAPVPHARDGVQFVRVALALAGSRWLALPRLVFGIGPLETVRVLLNLRRGTRRRIKSLATETFWSRGPLAIGKVAVRFKLMPAAPAPAAPLQGPNYLRAEFQQRLADQDIAFDFQVQRFCDEQRTPIEDAARGWEEKDAPFFTIARLVIPKQRLDTPEAIAVENRIDSLEFNPWITTPALRPLGGLNRARQLVYQASANHRGGRGTHVRPPWYERCYRMLATPLFRLINRFRPWYRLPTWLGALNVETLRHELREHNLHNTEFVPPTPVADPRLPAADDTALDQRTYDGTFNDLAQPTMGSQYARFGRNVPLALVDADPKKLLDPNPRTISRELMTRHTFQPARSLNLLAAAWIQFQVHDWFNHEHSEPAEAAPIKIDPEADAAAGDPWQGTPMRFRRTRPDGQHPLPNGLPAAYRNTGTHWWDASQLYGESPTEAARLRSGHDGKLTMVGQLLPFDPETGIEITGFAQNWWLGLSLMHTLFALEHNAVCDRLRRHYPGWSDEELFQTARLVIAALMAKIHTVEWTPGILGNPVLQIAMDTNWWGLAGERLTNALGRFSDAESISGIIGSPTDHHTAPYALTEEFVAVYRMHPLVPDDYSLHSHENDRLLDSVTFDQLQGRNTRQILKAHPLLDLYYSFGVAHPGAITLNNYPRFLQDFTNGDGERFDLAAVDITRDRERGVPRYNAFRRALRLPPLTDFNQLTKDADLAARLRKVYGGQIDLVDTMVGMFAETPPPGFGFSDTAFRIFILMASRRLKSDRFFTTDFNANVYSQVGLEWVRDNGMKSVLLRHFPELTSAVQHLGNVFAPWARARPRSGGDLSTRPTPGVVV